MPCRHCGGSDHKNNASAKCVLKKPRRRQLDPSSVPDAFDVVCSALKVGLAGHCKDKRVFDKIVKDVVELSPLFIEASVLINFKLFQEWKKGNFDKKIYDFLQYYYQLLDESKNHADLDSEYNGLRDTFHPKPFYDRSYRSNLFVANARRYGTYIWMYAENRMRRFFRRFTSDEEIIDNTMSSLFNEDSQLQPDRMLIGNAVLYLNYDGKGFYDIKSPSEYFKYVEVFCNLLCYNRENNLKTFRLVPLLKHGAHHLGYDSRAFFDMLRSIDMIKGERSDMPNEEWHEHFDLRG